jgi:hypothetical protein
MGSEPKIRFFEISISFVDVAFQTFLVLLNIKHSDLAFLVETSASSQPFKETKATHPVSNTEISTHDVHPKQHLLVPHRHGYVVSFRSSVVDLDRYINIGSDVPAINEARPSTSVASIENVRSIWVEMQLSKNE